MCNAEKTTKSSVGKKRLKLSNPREVRRALNRIANLVLNHEIDQKTANTLVYTCNVILACFKKFEIVEEEGEPPMKTDRQTTIQQLLRAAEITGDGDRREKYLNLADNLIRKELPKDGLALAEDYGLGLEK